MGDGGTLHGRAAHETVGTGRGQVIKTTWPDKSIPYSLDRGKRQFIADRPNQLGVADFTDVSTWHSWRVSTRMHTDFMPDALEHALYVRQPESGSMIHSSDRGLLYVSIRYTEWLGEAGVEPSVGSRGGQVRQRPG